MNFPHFRKLPSGSTLHELESKLFKRLYRGLLLGLLFIKGGTRSLDYNSHDP